MSDVTKEGVTVRVGQVWKDLDVRLGGRMCMVITVDAKYGFAWMSNTKTAAKATRTKIARMHKGATGWALVSEPVEAEVVS